MPARAAAVALALLLLALPFSGLVAPAPPAAAAERPDALYLEMEPAHVELLYGRDPRSDVRLPGSIVHGPTGQRHALTGLRFRGASSRFLPKKSFNIRWSRPQPFLFGSDRMNLNAEYTDPTQMRSALALRAFAELGRPASRTRSFELYLNGVYEGHYTHVERVDFDLVANAGLPARGTLVRDRFRRNPPLPRSMFAYDWGQVNDAEAVLAANVDSRGDPDWSALAELVRWVRATPPGDAFEAGFLERFDVEGFVDWLALHDIIGDIDSFADDYWLYLDHHTPGARWHVIPWDKDLTYGSHYRPPPHGETANDFFAYEYRLPEVAAAWQNRLVQRFLQTPALAERLRLRTLELLERFDGRWMAEATAAMAAGIRASVETAPGPGRFVLHPANHHGALGHFDDHVEALVDFAELRGAFLHRRLEPPGGPVYRAHGALQPGDEGRRVLLTDAAGWTVAAMTVGEVRSGGSVTVEVEPQGGLDGIDRRYTVRTTGGLDATVELSWYYRNEVGVAGGVPEENWYRDDVAVARQRDLAMVAEDPQGRYWFATRTNPFSNKVTATVDLGGDRAFVLVDWAGRLGRLAGQDRVATAVRLSQYSHPEGAPTVVLARSTDYADALAGGPLARSLDAPLLLTPSSGLDERVAEELDRLGASRVVLLGGRAALGERVEAAAAAGGRTVERLGGANRFETAVRVAAEMGTATSIYVAEGEHADAARGWPDALTAAAAGAAQGRPVLLVSRERIPPETAAALETLGVVDVTVVGGEAAVGAGVASALGTHGAAVRRVAGATRFETAAALAQRLADTGAAEPRRVWFATGLSYADALSAGPVVSRSGDVLLLVDGRGLAATPPVLDWLDRHEVRRGIVVGGPAAVPRALQGQLGRLLQPR